MTITRRAVLRSAAATALAPPLPAASCCPGHGDGTASCSLAASPPDFRVPLVQTIYDLMNATANGHLAS